MILEARLGERLEITKAGTSDTLQKMAALLELPTTLPEGMSPETVFGFTRADKKGRAGRPQYVLLSLPGKVAAAEDWAREVPDETVLEVLRDAIG